MPDDVAVGSSIVTAPPDGASASETGAVGRRRQSSRPHRSTHHVGGSPTTGSVRTGGLPHRREDSISPGDTSREPGLDLQDVGGGVGRDRWYGFIGDSFLYRLHYPQNENLRPTRQGQSIPRVGHEVLRVSWSAAGDRHPEPTARFLPASAFSCVFHPPVESAICV